MYKTRSEIVKPEINIVSPDAIFCLKLFFALNKKKLT